MNPENQITRLTKLATDLTEALQWVSYQDASLVVRALAHESYASAYAELAELANLLGPPKAEYQLREATRDDLAQIVELEALCFDNPWNREYFNSVSDRGELQCVAVDSRERVMGYIHLCEVDDCEDAFDDDQDDYEVWNLTVHPDLRRNGVASSLIAWAIEQAKKDMKQYLYAHVCIKDLAAHALAAEMGFEEVCIVRKYYGRDRPALLIERKL